MFERFRKFEGASRGIGLGLAKHLLEAVDGVRIIATYRNSDTAAKLFDLASSYSKDRLVVVKLDTTCEASYKSASSEIADAGVKSLDILVANAGIVSLSPTLTATAADTMQAFNTNVVGSMLTVQAFHGLLTADKEGAKLAVFTSATMGSIEKTLGELCEHFGAITFITLLFPFIVYRDERRSDGLPSFQSRIKHDGCLLCEGASQNGAEGDCLASRYII